MKIHSVVALFASSASALAQPDPTQDLLTNRHFQQEQSFMQERSFPSAIPLGARLKAIEQITTAASVTPPPSGTWVNIGPAPILFRQNNTFAGRVTTIAVDPTNKSHWYIGAAQGGVWETFNGGASWAPRTDNQPTLAMGALAIAPSSPNIIYAGTGEANFSGDSYSGVGVLKSTDGGATWQLLAGNGGFAGSSFSSIRVSPTDPTVVEAATAGSGTTGILKSTDGGITWSSKKRALATALEVAPDNFNNQYSGFVNSFTFDEVARSTDGGETWADVCGPWCDLPGSLGRTAIAIAPSDPGTVYVTIVNANARGIVDIWKTSNAWDAVPAWITLPHTNFCGSQCWYDLVLSVDPSDPNVLYAGGIGIWRFDGATWSEITGTSHVDQHAYVFVGNQLIVGNDGGVWTTKAGGIKNGNWKDRNGNLAITQFYKGSASPDGQFVLGGSQDNGTEAWTGPVNGPVPWSFVSGADGAANAISATSPSLDWAVSFQGQIILRTLDGGRTFSRADTTLDHTGAPFIGNFKKCPNDDNTFLAGTATLQKCSDFFSAVTPSWTLAFPNIFNATFGFGLMDFAASDSTCGSYACGFFSFGRPQVFITTDNGLIFNNLDPFQMLPIKLPTCLVFDPGHANVMYITFSGFGSGHVFQTVNATQAQRTFWTDISPPVDIPFNTVAVSSVDGAVYVGTDIGVWKSPDGGKTWSHYGPELGFPNVAVFDLEISKSGQVFAFTHGRGAFALVP